MTLQHVTRSCSFSHNPMTIYFHFTIGTSFFVDPADFMKCIRLTALKTDVLSLIPETWQVGPVHASPIPAMLCSHSPDVQVA